MDYPRYKENRMVEATAGQCAIACVMWILNYFRYTDFDKRDSWNMMQMIKKWKYRWSQDSLLTENEIGLNLYELWFDITMCYWVEREKRIDFVENPSSEKYKTFLKEKFHKYVNGDFWVDPNSRYTVDDGHMTKITDTTESRKILRNNDINKIWSANITDIIKKTNEIEYYLY